MCVLQIFTHSFASSAWPTERVETSEPGRKSHGTKKRNGEYSVTQRHRWSYYRNSITYSKSLYTFRPATPTNTATAASAHQPPHIRRHTHTRATQTLNTRTPPPSKHPTQHQHQTPSIRTTKPNPQLNPNKTANPPTQSTPRPQNPKQQPNTPPQRKNNHPHQNQKYQHTGSGQQRRREKKKRKGLERRKEERRRKRRKEKRKISAHGFEPRTFCMLSRRDNQLHHADN